LLGSLWLLFWDKVYFSRVARVVKVISVIRVRVVKVISVIRVRVVRVVKVISVIRVRIIRVRLFPPDC
jgi:hypothetical protein